MYSPERLFTVCHYESVLHTHIYIYRYIYIIIYNICVHICAYIVCTVCVDIDIFIDSLLTYIPRAYVCVYIYLYIYIMHVCVCLCMCLDFFLIYLIFPNGWSLVELHDKIRPGSPTAVPCDICISSWPWASLEPLAPRRRHNTARDRPRSSSCGGTSSALDEIPLGPWELVPHFHTRLECLGTMGDFEDLRKMMIYELNRYRIPDINKYKYMHKYAIPCLKYSMTQSIGTYWNQVLPHAIYYQWVQWCPMSTDCTGPCSWHRDTWHSRAAPQFAEPNPRQKWTKWCEVMRSVKDSKGGPISWYLQTLSWYVLILYSMLRCVWLLWSQERNLTPSTI